MLPDMTKRRLFGRRSGGEWLVAPSVATLGMSAVPVLTVGWWRVPVALRLRRFHDDYDEHHMRNHLLSGSLLMPPLYSWCMACQVMWAELLWLSEIGGIAA